MLQLLERIKERKILVDGFHPNRPVKPRHAIKIDQVPILRPQYFPQDEPKSWLDQEDAVESISTLQSKNYLSETDAQLCRDWVENGYVIIKGLFDAPILDRAWADYEKAITDGKITPEVACEFNGLPGRNLNTHFQVKKIAALLKHRKITRIVSLLMGVKCLPFQTITGHNGSQQPEHSDAIHMTTYPLDYLAAAWIAFEDIDPLAGPLVYYPGSHRLPYFLSTEAGISIDDFATNGYTTYREKYESGIQQIIREQKLQPQYFLAKRGDVLIWHSNLIHGGSPRHNLELSRKALVCHYFAQGCICYHDLASSLAHIHHQPQGRIKNKIKNLTQKAIALW